MTTHRARQQRSSRARAGSRPQCPLLAQSRHCQRAERCPLLGVNRTLAGCGLNAPNDPRRKSRAAIFSANHAPTLSCSHKETASFFGLKDFWLSLASDNYSTLSSLQTTWLSRRSTVFRSIWRHLPFSLSNFLQAWALIEAAFDFEPMRCSRQQT